MNLTRVNDFSYSIESENLKTQKSSFKRIFAKRMIKEMLQVDQTTNMNIRLHSTQYFNKKVARQGDALKLDAQERFNLDEKLKNPNM